MLATTLQPFDIGSKALPRNPRVVAGSRSAVAAKRVVNPTPRLPWYQKRGTRPPNCSKICGTWGLSTLCSLQVQRTAAAVPFLQISPHNLWLLGYPAAFSQFASKILQKTFHVFQVQRSHFSNHEANFIKFHYSSFSCKKKKNKNNPGSSSPSSGWNLLRAAALMAPKTMEAKTSSNGLVVCCFLVWKLVGFLRILFGLYGQLDLTISFELFEYRIWWGYIYISIYMIITWEI